jgi:putative FmdB family regulatory protein
MVIVNAMRYDYKCSKCNHLGEISMSMRYKVKPLKCPKCGRRTFRRQLVIGPNALATVSCVSSRIKYQNRFPYVSNAMPFGGDLAGDGEHVGPLKKIRVVSQQHEERLRQKHGFVGEDKLGYVGTES